jgi:hypothetical protein
LLTAILGLASSAARAEPPTFDFSAHDDVLSLEQKIEGVRRELVAKFPIGSPVVDVIAALRRWGNRSGGHCQLRTDRRTPTTANARTCPRHTRSSPSTGS